MTGPQAGEKADFGRLDGRFSKSKIITPCLRRGLVLAAMLCQASQAAPQRPDGIGPPEFGSELFLDGFIALGPVDTVRVDLMKRHKVRVEGLVRIADLCRVTCAADPLRRVFGTVPMLRVISIAVLALLIHYCRSFEDAIILELVSLVYFVALALRPPHRLVQAGRRGLLVSSRRRSLGTSEVKLERSLGQLVNDARARHVVCGSGSRKLRSCHLRDIVRRRPVVLIFGVMIQLGRARVSIGSLS